MTIDIYNCHIFIVQATCLNGTCITSIKYWTLKIAIKKVLSLFNGDTRGLYYKYITDS
jgi:hypothetical protein